MEENKKPRTTVTEYSSFSSSNGMMFGSDASYSVRLYIKEGTPALCVSDKKPFGPTTTRVYRADADAFERLNALLADVDLFALAQLKASPPPYVVYDYSSSSGLTLATETVLPNGGVRRDLLPMSTVALREHGYEALMDAVSDLVRSFILPENLLSETVEERSDMPIGMKMTDAAAPVLKDEEWRCAECGAVNSGRFCSECGSPRS